MALRKIEFSKIDRPESVSAGSAPILQWLDIASLVVDESYQRDLKPQNWKAIRKIAANFKWSMFSPVFVSPVEGGKYAIIDGQHRSHAAAICGFEQVPCQIVPMAQHEQAAAFAAVNGVVTAVTYHQLLKAALAAGEQWAVNAKEIANAGGCRLMTHNGSSLTKKPGEIFGVKGFLAVVNARPRGPLIAALKMLMATEGYNDNREIWENGVLMPLLMALTERPAALANPAFSGALAGFDIWQMIDDDHVQRRARQRIGEKYPPKSETWRAGVLEWLDKAFPARMALPASAKMSRQETLAHIGKIGSGA
ncbi:ParB N-terminal domain-containing protein [uncultured Agrobacterium sp.]|uniref:ParB N-terminal domain-containing protein n=1 Tax=uncultured Agrobacterium sp. TaxID=157277 RepID=UPI00258793C9|nr:ParB N-terminal domain-containing protein [uncultured Agrobacterium sp.]